MSVIKISANRSVVVVQRGALGLVANLGAYTVGQLSAFTVGRLASV